MNIKALNKNELHDLFQKYKDVPNINEIKIMGKVTEFSQRGDSTKGNPVYSIISPKTELSVAPFETVKLSLDIPSPARIDAEGNPYRTRLPLFTTGEPVVEYKNVLTEDTKYVCGIGRVQNYKVKARFVENDETNKFLYNLVERVNGSPDMELYESLKEILKVSYNGADVNNVTLVNIWCDHIENANDVATELVENGKLPEVNQVRLQGLVYMPPSIRQLASGSLSLHVKVRVRRQDSPDQPIPVMHQAKYDYINVIAFGDKVEEYYENIKQGHPIYVTGRLESSHFRKQKKVSNIQAYQLANKLGVLSDSPIIKDIENYFIEKKEQISFPNFNIWADNIVYEESELPSS